MSAPSHVSRPPSPLTDSPPHILRLPRKQTTTCLARSSYGLPVLGLKGNSVGLMTDLKKEKKTNKKNHCCLHNNIYQLTDDKILMWLQSAFQKLSSHTSCANVQFAWNLFPRPPLLPSDGTSFYSGDPLLRSQWTVITLKIHYVVQQSFHTIATSHKNCVCCGCNWVIWGYSTYSWSIRLFKLGFIYMWGIFWQWYARVTVTMCRFDHIKSLIKWCCDAPNSNLSK